MGRALPSDRLTCIDLFCGGGGFSLGLERAGFSVLAAIDFNKEAIEVFRKNFSSVAHILQRDLTRFPPRDMAALLGTDQVDLIVGGPPCQGFSTVRQRDGANNGPRMVDDARRHLYQEFLRYVEFFRPKVFVMENVLGIKSADGGKYFTRVQKEARAKGYRVHPQVEKAFMLGVPQKRQRQLIVGTRLDLPEYFPGSLQPAPPRKRIPDTWRSDLRPSTRPSRHRRGGGRLRHGAAQSAHCEIRPAISLRIIGSTASLQAHSAPSPPP